MLDLQICSVALADGNALPHITGFYQYVLAANGLFIRSEDSRMAAVVQLSAVPLRGLAPLDESFEWKLPHVPARYLDAILASARWHLPNEAMYQISYDGIWRTAMPRASATPVSLVFEEDTGTAIDLHSHARMEPFFSATDDGDEQGFRVYCVVGRVDTESPEILCRVGVYGHHMPIPADAVFESTGVFRDVHLDPPAEDEANEANDSDILETESGLLVADWGDKR